MGLCVAITLHQQTKNQIISYLCTNVQKKRHEKNVFTKYSSHVDFRCRRGSRTAHDVVSQKAKFGGQPQSKLKKTSRLYFPFILDSSPPRQEGTAANFVILQ
jgi:hypothetical protein